MVYKARYMQDQHYRLIPSTVNNLEVGVKSFVPQQQKIKVNAVDFNTKELVYSWLMLIESEKANIQRNHKIKTFTHKSSY